MPQYILTYLGGDQPSSPEEGKQHFSKYMDWLSSLGDSAVSPANPLTKEYVSNLTLCDHVSHMGFVEKSPDEIRSFL